MAPRLGGKGMRAVDQCFHLRTGRRVCAEVASLTGSAVAHRLEIPDVAIDAGGLTGRLTSGRGEEQRRCGDIG